MSGVTYGQMTASVESLSQSQTSDANTTLLFHYPYSMVLQQANNEDYLFISAAVNYTCDKQVYVDNVLTSFVDTIDTSAIYNRSNDAARTM